MENLPTLNDDQQELIDNAISYDELSTAASKSNNKSPGIDGLPSEFYKTFWTLIGKDLHEVFLSFIEHNNLPLSCRRAVLTMIPKKKGDTSLLKICRPVSILCCDYTILNRALSFRLRTVLLDILDIDQSYCVSGRHSSHNIRFISDATCYANQ